MTEGDADKYIVGANGEKRLKGVSLSIPVITGTIAFSLGKKATDQATHRWTCFLRSPTGEDLSHVIKKVTFQLHSSFENPNRDVAYQPFELTEHGWGEFEILVQLHFVDSAKEPPIELPHFLMLGLDAQGNPQKKPYLFENYEELVFWEPTEEFYNAVKNHQPIAAPPSQVGQYFGKFDSIADYNRVQNARKRLAPATANLKAQLAMLESEEAQKVAPSPMEM